jgi:hypothetical protein
MHAHLLREDVVKELSGEFGGSRIQGTWRTLSLLGIHRFVLSSFAV